MKCTRDDTIPLRLELRQQQKVGRETINVHTTATAQVACSPTTTTWGRKMFLTSGTWQAGAAQATATTVYTPDWVTPASVVMECTWASDARGVLTLTRRSGSVPPTMVK